MDIKSFLFMSVVIAWQVVPLECDNVTYPIGTPSTVTVSPYPITQSSIYITVTVSPDSPTTTTTTTTPNPVPTSTTTTTPYISTTSTTTTRPSITSNNIVTIVTSQNTSAGIWGFNYSGYLLLNSTVAGSPPVINETDLDDWLKNRTNRSREFKILKFNQATGNRSRKKRNTDQISEVTFEVGSNANNFSEEFKKTENISSYSTIRSNKVEEALLWPKGQSVPCPDIFRCESGLCQISDNGTFYCASPSGSGVGGDGNTTNLYGLIAIPFIIIIIILVVVPIVFLVRRCRQEKQKQYITKIHPAAFSKTDEYIDTATKRSLEGFSSVKSSNFEYENQTLETGLY